MSISINKAELSSLQELREIGIDSYLPHYVHLWKPNGIEWYMERCFGEDFLRKEISDPNVEYYIVEGNGKNIGMMKLILQMPLPDSDEQNGLYLEKIYFIREWTGKGVGRQAVEYALQRAADLNRDCVWLMAMDTSSKPIAAYEQAGFTKHSYTNLGDEFELMKKEYRGMIVMKHCLEKNEN